MLLGTLGASLLGNLITGNEVTWAGKRAKGTSWWQGAIRAGQDF